MLVIGADGRTLAHVRALPGSRAVESSPAIDVLWFRVSRRADEVEAIAARLAARQGRA